MPNHSSAGDVSEEVAAEIICVVDDDWSVLKSVSRMLESDGLTARVFREPQLFLQYLAANPVSVLVMDIWMEKMSGMELLAHLCARSPQTRVIFMTGHEDRAAEAMVRSAGAFAFLIKPFDDDQFLQEVHRALNFPR